MLNTGDRIAVWGIVISAASAIVIAAITLIYSNEVKILACDHLALGCGLPVALDVAVYDSWASSGPTSLHSLFPGAAYKCGDTDLPMPATGGVRYTTPPAGVAPDRSIPAPNNSVFLDPYIDPPKLTRYLVWTLQLTLPPNAIDEPLTVNATYYLPFGSAPDSDVANITVDPAGQTQCKVIPFYREVLLPGHYSLVVKVTSPRLSMGRNRSDIDIRP